MRKVNAVIIGAGTSGAYMARLLAEQGLSVTVLEALDAESVGTKYDIFHIEEKEFEPLGIPRPVEGDAEWAFEFEENLTADPLNLYPKCAINPIVGLHMKEYTKLLNAQAVSAGARIVYEAAVFELLLDENRVTGVKYRKNGRNYSLAADVVVDCSGIAAAGRSKLPDGALVEKFKPGSDDVFYVVLRYVKLKLESDFLKGSCGWPFFKSWIAPCADPGGAIVGIGASHGFDRCEQVFAEMQKHFNLPEYELEYIERGVTPYTRSPFGFVADGFVACGDSACMTKPLNGEGVTSSMHMIKDAAPIIAEAVKTGDCSKSHLWQVNVDYNRTQGAEFAFLRALLVGVVNAAGFDEFEYAFESGLITDELMNGGKIDLRFAANAVAKLIQGIASRRVKASTVKAALEALRNGIELSAHYKAFPTDLTKAPEWEFYAEKLWKKVGKIS